MINQGLIPKWVDQRDRDFHKSFGVAGTPTEYIEFSVDHGFPVMDQNAMGLTYGCTGMAQGHLCTCQDGVVADPAEIYDNTPPYTRAQGRVIRLSLKRICKNGYRKYLTSDAPANPRLAFYSCRAQGVLDWFDAIYVAMLSTRDENRAVSIGIPWFPEFQMPGFGLGKLGNDGVLPIPDDMSPSRGSWHNAAIAKIVIKNGEPMFGIQSWQGPGYGDQGWCYMNRALANKIFNINMTEAFTVTKKTPQQMQTINLDIQESIVVFIMSLLKKLGMIFP